MSQKCCIFAVDFRVNHEALCSFCLRKREKFLSMAEWYDGSRVLRGLFSFSSIKGFSHDLLKKNLCTVPRFVFERFRSSWCRESSKGCARHVLG